MCGKTFWGEKKKCSRSCANQGRLGIVYDGANKKNKASKGWALKEALGKDRGGQCEACEYENYNVLQVHHVVPKKAGGGDELSNLELLCPNCHMEVHHGFGVYGGSSR